ncbi:hypothetical protein AAGR22_13695 [Erwinia sp. HDF1-3R]|uniref:hypothetical protein n=1 Tax=Erwinia sp. HDF1-3R TaxID=3141543 RepID=UPI0031F4807C
MSSGEWLQVINDDVELSVDKMNGDFFAVWSGKSEHDGPWLEWSDGRISTKHPDQALYCKMLQIAKKLNAVVVDDDDHKYILSTDLLNPSWANQSTVVEKYSFWGKLISKVRG